MQTIPNNPTWGGRLRQRWLGLSARETSFERRGFRGGSPALRRRLETVGISFMGGYNAALADARPDRLAPQLEAMPREFLGFAYEGAAMGLALLDWMTPWRRWRVPALLQGAGDAHAYMVHVGAGWVLARVPGSVERFLDRFDPLLRWLLMDGYGFHEAFFHFQKYLAGQPVPPRVKGYARRVFDQGFGRCLWFVEGGEVDRIQATLHSFPPARHNDLWSGVGLSSTYAGEASEHELRTLRQAAGAHRAALAQGSAFAAKARMRAGNPTPYTEIASQILCGLSAWDAAQVTDLALENLPANGAEPAYEFWRQRIQHQLKPQTKMTHE